ncbi:Acidic mammalian chitinase [Amphibalanus amphitrite]|uniref:chitinase n=1 Tax=Amphibalanus amphitrite TaxID=1232801 RepID=A0A6A4XDB2_AMPAM|nr:Acidic mammalian chitinase [Amphibalanus amphitrite]
MRVAAVAALVAVTLGVAVNEVAGASNYLATCYYGTWAVYRPGDGKFDVEDFDPMLCTHGIYGFAGLDEATHKIKSLDPWNDLYDNYGKGAYMRFTDLKKRNPELKTLLGIGGWNEGSTKYSEMAASASSRQTFIASVVDFLKTYNFDGLDLDWEYPAERGGKTIDKASDIGSCSIYATAGQGTENEGSERLLATEKERILHRPPSCGKNITHKATAQGICGTLLEDYVQLIKEIKEAFKPEGFLLTAAVGPGKTTIDDSYKLTEMAKYLDIFNVMAYDYHGSWETFTGHVSPPYMSPLDITNEMETFNVNFTVNYYLDGGVPKEKMAMGIPLYGHGFTLNDPAVHGLYAPANQPQPACPYTRQAGICGFNEICTMLNEGGWTTVRDPDQQAVYSYKDRIWVGYDDLESVKIKTDYIKSLGLAGSMVWSVETDDFRGLCGFGTKNPLMTAIWTNLNGDIPTPVPHTTTPRPTGPVNILSSSTTLRLTGR